MVAGSSNNKRKSYNRFSLYCHFCESLQETKEDLRLIYLRPDTAVKICLKCLEIIDKNHKMKVEDFK
jgi:hypothetical protein